MTQTLSMNVQKWTYERGNYQIIVENAWSAAPIYTQERITVNGERVRDCIPAPISLLFWRTMFEDTVLDKDGEQNLKVQWKSGFRTCKARVLINEEPVAWIKAQSMKWNGPKGNWPEDDEYNA